MRVAFHAINGVGLGHLARATCLALEVRALAPRARLLVVTNAADAGMLEREGLDYVRLPPRADEPHADPARARRALWGGLERDALGAVYATFAPDLAVFDTHAPPWLVGHAASLGSRAVLVLRELRPALLSAWLGSREAASFDRIVMPHEPGEVDLSAAPRALPVVCVGPVVRLGARPVGTEGPSPAEPSPLVVALAGGGGQPVDARRFVRAAADAHLLARARVPSLRTLLVTGPYGRPPPGVEAFDGLEVVRTVDRVGERLARATLALTQAGYNTVAELRALGVPAVLVPGARKAEDQRARALRLVARGAAAFARPEARSIADAIEGLLTRPGALDAMRAAHASWPLRPKNREAAEAVLRPLFRPAGPPRRVVIVAHDFAPKLGGMQTVARELARHVREAGVEPILYVTRGLAPPEVEGLAPSSIRPIFLPTGSPPRIDLWGDLMRLLGALAHDLPDAVHLCNAGLAPWVRPLKAVLPCAVTCHVHGNDLVAPWVHHGGRAAAYERSVTRGLASADALFAVSRFTLSLLEARGLEKGRLLYGGVDSGRFRPGPPDPALGARYGIGADDEVLLTVSRLAPRKGHRVAIAALARLAPSHPRLVYAFTGESPRVADALREEARALGVEGRLRPLGAVPEADLPSVYRLARVFALLSEGDERDVEGFGIALLEAAASGLPLLVARSGGMVEAVAPGVTGLVVPPGDAAATAEALSALLDDGAKARAMGLEARRRAEVSFSWPAAALSLVNAWAEALAAPLRARKKTGLEKALGRHDARDGGRAQALRIALAGAPDGASLARLVRAEAYAERAKRAAREAALRRAAGRGRAPSIRATGEGYWLLPEALDDCEAAGVRPAVEIKLRRFLEPEFLAHALPRVGAVSLVHAVPSAGPRDLVGRVRAGAGAFREKVRSLRLVLSPEAQADPSIALSALPEAYALRKALGGAGVVVLPPPELTRYLSETPSGPPAADGPAPERAAHTADRALLPAPRLLAPRPGVAPREAEVHAVCTMAWRAPAIDADGTVTPCRRLRLEAGADFVMGNALETPLAEIWRGAKYRAFRAAMLADRGAMPVCGACRDGTHDRPGAGA